MSRWPRMVTAALMFSIVPAVAGCHVLPSDPYPAAPTATAEVDLTLANDGGADVQLRLPAEFASDRRELAWAVTQAVFPDSGVFDSDGGSDIHVRLDDNAGQNAFAVAHLATAYHTGSHVTVTIDTTAVVRVLAASGVSTMDLTICVPAVPMTLTATPAISGDQVRGCRTWQDVQSVPPRLTVEMTPAPLRWWVALELVVGAYAAVVAALALRGRGRRRLAVLAAAGTSLVLCGVAVLTAAGEQVDNVGVSGHLTGGALTVAAVPAYAVIPIGFLSLIVILIAVIRPSPR